MDHSAAYAMETLALKCHNTIPKDLKEIIPIWLMIDVDLDVDLSRAYVVENVTTNR